MSNDKWTIGIIGGTGGMGRWFERIFLEAGHRVIITGRNTPVTNEEAVDFSDIVMLSIPTEAVPGVVAAIAPRLTGEKLLMDVCSLKADVMKTMMAGTSAAVVGTHPLFGPFTESLKGQNVVVCPGRGDLWLERVEALFGQGGAVVTRMSPEEHDRHMAVIQGLTHLMTISLGRTLQKLDMTPETAARVATPVFRNKLDLVGRLFAQDLSLFQRILGENGHVREVVEAFRDAMAEGSRAILDDGGQEGAAFLESIRTFLGPFCEVGLKNTNLVLNHYSSVASEEKLQ